MVTKSIMMDGYAKIKYFGETLNFQEEVKHNWICEYYITLCGVYTKGSEFFLTLLKFYSDECQQKLNLRTNL